MTYEREEAKGQLDMLKPGEKVVFRPFWVKKRTASGKHGAFEAASMLVRLLSPFNGREAGTEEDTEFKPNDVVWISLSGTYVMRRLNDLLRKDSVVRCKDPVEQVFTFKKEVTVDYEFKESKKNPGNFYKNLRIRIDEKAD
jgi:hypothetical protein